nr:hypothetical protein Iba_chr06bCG11580 [Ipomoea batatas]
METIETVEEHTAMNEDGQMMFEENIETTTNYVEDFMFTVLSPYAIHCVPGIEKKKHNCGTEINPIWHTMKWHRTAYHLK